MYVELLILNILFGACVSVGGHILIIDLPLEGV